MQREKELSKATFFRGGKLEGYLPYRGLEPDPTV